MRERDHLDSVETMFQRSFRYTCKNCNWYVILRRNGAMLAMFINNFNECPKCGGREFATTKPTILEALNPLEQIRKLYYKALGYK
ncbi:MAG: hypothetical protein GX923_01075 [Clostridia bacterium]|nr:hypothetical protein [Clostridia bacterium]